MNRQIQLSFVYWAIGWLVAMERDKLSLWRLFTCLLMFVNALHSSVADVGGKYTTDYLVSA